MIEENIVVGAGGDYPLNGKLTLPKGTNGPIPAVVLVHGSGPSNMDAKVGNNAFFKQLAHGLATHGIASIRYDKRTLVYGKQLKHNPAMSVKEETIEDAVLAADLLRKDSRIASDHVYIIGHSMGGMLTPRIDAEGGNFAGLIIMAGSLRTLDEIMISQNEQVLRSLNKLLKWIASKQVAAFTKKLNHIRTLSDEQAKETKILGKYLRAYYFKEMADHPARSYLENVNKPIFIMQGESDFQVELDKDYYGYKELLGDKPNVSYKLYKGLNHIFMPALYHSVLKAKQEYKAPRLIEPQVIQDIAEWIHSKQ